ncbi:sodium channel protein Nach-like [Cataglyphis hispanica]|uniref:sodium channel protein Nach-like n=1 Tax=Cataglyphis hispanica TaxID=1086592 RepID=UPI00217FEC74|nr:sodium channel protein Nach-like [Cataglyphis hispanica]
MWAEKDQIKRKKNIAVTQAWMSKDSQRSSTKYRSFKIILEYLKLYCQYSSLSSLKYLADSQKTWFERILWVIIHCAIISGLIFMVYISYKEFVTSPLLTSMDSDSYSTIELNFPAIAICPVNRISRRSAMELATDIFNANVTDLSINEIMRLLKQLGNNYPSNFIMERNRDIEVDQLLTKYYKGFYDITKIMKNLSPLCMAMLLKCKLHGTYRPCTTLFEFRKTQDGFCCTFNYIREPDDIPTMRDVIKEPLGKVHKVDDLGIEHGLTVLLDPFLDDYFYSILPVKGWKIIVFHPADYPDVSSGGVTEVLAMPRTETYIDVSATTFFSTEIVQAYPVNQRNCIFSEEIRTTHSDTIYTYSDCIVDCKIYDVIKCCNCRPFFYPRRGEKEYSQRICTNADLACLSKYKSKWFTVFPHEDNQEIVSNSEWALHCDNCYPTCDDTGYDVLSSKSHMSIGEYRTDLLSNFNVTDQGILHIFFSKYGSIRLKQDVAYYWYDLLSDIGGICGVFIGFSLISIVEVLYFLVLALLDLFCGKSTLREDDDREKETKSIPTQTVQTIYWNELLPRSWQSIKFPNNDQLFNNKAR